MAEELGEPLDARVPEPFVGAQPVVGAGEGTRVDADVVDPAADGALHQPRPFERLDVLRCRGERHLVRRGELADGVLAAGEALEHGAAGMVAEGAEDEVEAGLLFNHKVENIVIGNFVNLLVERLIPRRSGYPDARSRGTVGDSGASRPGQSPRESCSATGVLPRDSRGRIYYRGERVRPPASAMERAVGGAVVRFSFALQHWRGVQVRRQAAEEHMSSPAEPARGPIERLHDALRRRDAAALREALASDPALRARIDAPAFPFNAPAIVAFAREAAIVDVLLEFGADPNRRSEWWAGPFHALHFARGEAADRLIAAGATIDICAAANLDRIDVLTRMIAANPACVRERGGDGQTPLHFARSREAIDLLLAAGADIDARDVDHRSTAAAWMLEGAQGAGRYDMARYLVERGASTDIFLAAALGLTDRVRAMLEQNPALLALRTGRGEYGEQPPSSYHIYFWTIGDSRSPLDVAGQFGHDETVRAMMEFASPLQRLLLACRSGDERGARALVRDHPGIIASMTEDDHRAIADAAWNRNAAAVALMLELGFDPRTPGHDSGTSLHCAAWAGTPDTVSALLKHRDARALVDIRDAHYGATPLDWCCHGSRYGNTSHDHAAVARLLLAAGAEPGANARDASPSVAAVLATHLQ